MKRLISVVVFAIVLLSTTVSFSQNDSSIATKTYFGVLSCLIYDTTGVMSHNTTFRAAAEVQTHYLGLNFVARGIFTTQASGSFGQLWAEKNIGNFKVSLGYQGRPITLGTRPNPVYGHFEAPAKSIIPGSHPGNRGSIPLGTTRKKIGESLFFVKLFTIY
ncbi:MAG: hypothetical protein NTY12_02775 [Candidatus Falkowbacteria bacterium]|nr:hypothetical protein [Candidatus Falkowbacteria bacterium]